MSDCDHDEYEDEGFYEPRFRLKLEDREGPGHDFEPSKWSCSSDDFCMLLIRAMSQVPDMRREMIISQMALMFLDVPRSDDEPWPGYNMTMDKLVATAEEVVEGWSGHDEEFHSEDGNCSKCDEDCDDEDELEAK